MKSAEINLQQIESRLLQVAAELLPTAHDVVGLCACISALNDTADELAGHRPVACGAGCPHCCVLNVAVLLPEAAVIAAWLELKFHDEQRVELITLLKKQADRVRWMEDSERIHRKVVCPFLDKAGRCGIYPVRPLVCRGVTSLDKQACCHQFDPSNLDDPEGVPMDTVRKMVIDATFGALAHALEQHHYSSRSIELSRGVAAFLEKPELVQELLSGRSLPAELWD